MSNNISDFSWSFCAVVISQTDLAALFYPLNIWPLPLILKGLMSVNCDAEAPNINWLCCEKPIQLIDRCNHCQITGKDSVSTKAFQPHTQWLHPNETKGHEERHAGRLGSTVGSKKKTFGCEMLNLIIPDNTSCHRNQSKGWLIIQASAFVKPLRISAHLCAFLIWTHQTTRLWTVEATL